MSNDHRPVYVQNDIKQALLSLGLSGTVYALVMPETQRAQASILDGCDRDQIIEQLCHDLETGVLRDTEALQKSLKAALDQHRTENYFAMFQEPWTQKQDPAHDIYFKTWLRWASPVLTIDEDDFPFRYPTAGASEGIFKIMAEYIARHRGNEIDTDSINHLFNVLQTGAETPQNINSPRPRIHVFDGEYEGFSAYASALNIDVVRHAREDWQTVSDKIAAGEQFWISQPSAIDGNVWLDFNDFARMLNEKQPGAQLIPDLTYVGNVAKPYDIDLTSPNIPLFVMSSSKPLGMYYHRVGGVFSKTERPSLFGNKWFKGLQALAQATEMMRHHDVFELPARYRQTQLTAVDRAKTLLGLPDLVACDVSVMAMALPGANLTPLQTALLRGRASEQIIRVCLTPMMTTMIDPQMAPDMSRNLQAAWATPETGPRYEV